MTKRRPPRALFDNVSDLKAEDIVDSEILRKLLNVEVPKAIEDAIQSKKSYATVFEINDSSSYIEIHKKDWPAALEHCLQYYIDIEDYSTCSEIRSKIEELKKHS